MSVDEEKTKTKSVLLRLPPELHAAIEAAAKEDLRTTSGEIMFALKEWLSSRNSAITKTNNQQEKH